MTQQQNQKLTEAEEEALREHIRTQSQALLQKLPALGPIIILYLNSSHRRFNFISDLEWLVLPPLVRNQCKLYMKQEYPVSFISWALLDKKAEARLLQNGGKLRPEDWSCGNRPWIIDIVSPFGGVGEVLTDIRGNEFAGQTLRMLAPDTKSGGVIARELPPLSESDPESSNDAEPTQDTKPSRTH